MRVDHEPAAAQIWLISGRRATIYKLAYDERFAPLSIGSILTKTMFDHVLENDGVSEIDYGVGSERYKRDWMSHSRRVIGLIGFAALGGIARQPEAAGKIQVNMIVMAALVEGAAIIALLVICYALVGKV